MNYKNISLVVGFVALLLALLFLSSQYSFKRDIKEASEIQKVSQELLQNITQKQIFYVINKGKGEALKFKIIPSGESTVFSLLQELSKKKNFEISYKIYPNMGVFIESIAGFRNGTDGKYWQYWVNGKLPMVSADKMKIQTGDTIEWKFEKPQF